MIAFHEIECAFSEGREELIGERFKLKVAVDRILYAVSSFFWIIFHLWGVELENESELQGRMIDFCLKYFTVLHEGDFRDQASDFERRFVEIVKILNLSDVFAEVDNFQP